MFALTGSVALVQHQKLSRHAVHLRDALEKRDPWCEESPVRDQTSFDNFMLFLWYRIATGLAKGLISLI